MARVQSWEVSDAFWAMVEPLIPVKQRKPGREYQREPGGGRKPLEARKVFSAIVCVLRSGMQWQALPKEGFGCPSAVHRYFLEWQEAGFFEALWQQGLAEYEELEGIAWQWQAADGAMMKAPMAQEAVGKNPTDREKNGSKRLLHVDEHGVPLGLILCGANRHDVSQLETLLDAKMIEQPGTDAAIAEHLCLDAGFVGQEAATNIRAHGYIPQVRPGGEEIAEPDKNPAFKPRRWIVEVAHSWFNRFRKLKVRCEKKASAFLALNQLAAAIITIRKYHLIYG